MEALDNGQVDFMLEVRNDQASGNEIAQLEMSVDGGAPELVNIIANLPAGESASFAFLRDLAPGAHTIRFTVWRFAYDGQRERRGGRCRHIHSYVHTDQYTDADGGGATHHYSGTDKYA